MLRLVVIVAASVILFFSGADAAQVTEPCDYGWSPFNSACYHIFLERMNWSAANASCQEKGADLLSLKPSDNVKMLHLNEETESVIKQMTWWVAFEMNSLEGTLVSVPVNSSFTGHISLWKPNSPSNQDDYYCAFMDPGGLLYDAPCSYSYLFICEKHLENSNKMKECETDWTPIASSCYKLSTVQRNWFGALRICSAYDADLMSVNSLQELVQIKKKIQLKSKAWVGLQKIPWQWLKEPSPYTMFIPWEIGEPSNNGGIENCAELTIKGLLNDVTCSSSLQYICEKSMNNENCSTDSAVLSSCYTVSTEETNFPQAKANCLADGANLLSIGSSEKLLQVRKELKRRERESHWWVGLRKSMSSNNTWEWLEEPPSSTPLVMLWDLNQPDNARGVENCAEIFASGFMNDLNCYTSRPYICEKHINQTRDSKNCETGWILISSSCYKLYIEEMDWSDAQASCKKDGANMLSINSLDELLHIKKEMERFPVISKWWVGLRKTEPFSTWRWVEPSSNTPQATMWDTDEPSDEDNNDCAVLGPTGFLSAASCQRSRRYICKKQLRTMAAKQIIQNAFCLLWAVDNAIADCDAGWILINRSCYKLSTDAVTWMDAQANCTLHGSNLFSVSSLVELIKKKIIERHPLSASWVGLQKLSSGDRRWRWQGVSSSFSPRVTQWKEDELDKVLSQKDCVVMDSEGLLNGVACNSSHHVLCVKISRLGNDVCETGWFFVSQNCYKFFPMMMQSEAQKSCEAEGGNLLSVNTFHELMEILKMIRLESSRWWVNLQITDPGASAASVRSIGKSENTTGTCGEITPDGLNYADCTLVRSYICQKKSK